MTDTSRRKTYSGSSEAESTAQFEADAAEAAQYGWLPASRSWQGTALTVVYEQRETPPESAPNEDAVPTGVARADRGEDSDVSLEVAEKVIYGDTARRYYGGKPSAETATSESVDGSAIEKPGPPIAAPPERFGPTQAEIAKAVAAGIDAARKSRGIGPIQGVFTLLAAGIFGFAGLYLVTLQSVAGNTVAEAFYNGVGMMSFGLAALSLALGSRR